MILLKLLKLIDVKVYALLETLNIFVANISGFTVNICYRLTLRWLGFCFLGDFFQALRKFPLVQMLTLSCRAYGTRFIPFRSGGVGSVGVVLGSQHEWLRDPTGSFLGYN